MLLSGLMSPLTSHYFMNGLSYLFFPHVLWLVALGFLDTFYFLVCRRFLILNAFNEQDQIRRWTDLTRALLLHTGAEAC